MNTEVKILVVDNNPGIRRVAERVLGEVYTVDLAEGVDDGLARAQETEYDILITDIQLSDGDGYHLNRVFKEKYPETDVIIMTGSHTEPDQKLYQALKEDAFFFIFKPFDRAVLLALVERCLRLRSAHQELDLQARRLAEDLEKAHYFQKSLITDSTVFPSGWRIEGAFLPCDQIGGDFYFFQEKQRGLSFVLCDAAGHGVKAAMVAGMLATNVRSAMQDDPGPAAVISHLRQRAFMLDPQLNATLVYGVAGADGSVEFVSAGHPHPLILSGDGARFIEKNSPLLIYLGSALIEDRVNSVQLVVGEKIILYSDGLTEAQSEDNRDFGTEKLMETVRACAELDAAQLVEEIVTSSVRHRGQRPQDDDISIIVIERV